MKLTRVAVRSDENDELAAINLKQVRRLLTLGRFDQLRRLLLGQQAGCLQGSGSVVARRVDSFPAVHLKLRVSTLVLIFEDKVTDVK